MEQQLYGRLYPQQGSPSERRALQRENVIVGSGRNAFPTFREPDQHAFLRKKGSGFARSNSLVESYGSDSISPKAGGNNRVVFDNRRHKHRGPRDKSTPGLLPYELSPTRTPGFGTKDVGYDHFKDRAGWVKSAGSMKGKGGDDYIFRQRVDKKNNTEFAKMKKIRKPANGRKRSVKKEVRLLPGQRTAAKDKISCPICSSISRARPLALHECRHTRQAKLQFKNRAKNDERQYRKAQREKEFRITLKRAEEREKIARSMGKNNSTNVTGTGRHVLKSTIVPNSPDRSLHRFSREKGSRVYAGSSIFDDPPKGEKKIVRMDDLLQSSDPLPEEIADHARKNFMNDPNWRNWSNQNSEEKFGGGMSGKFTDDNSFKAAVGGSASQSSLGNSFLGSGDWSSFMGTGGNVAKDTNAFTGETAPLRSALKTSSSYGSRAQTSKPGTRQNKSKGAGSGGVTSPNARNRRLVRFEGDQSPTQGKKGTKAKAKAPPRDSEEHPLAIIKMQKQEALKSEKKLSRKKTPTATYRGVKKNAPRGRQRIRNRKARKNDFANSLVLSISNFTLEDLWAPLIRLKFKYRDEKKVLASSRMFQLEKGKVKIDDFETKIAFVLDRAALKKMKKEFLTIQVVDGSKTGIDAVLGDCQVPLEKLAKGESVADSMQAWHSENLDHSASFDINASWAENDVSWKMFFDDQFAATLGLDFMPSSHKRSASPKNRVRRVSILKESLSREALMAEIEQSDETQLRDTYIHEWGGLNSNSDSEPEEQEQDIDEDASIANWDAQFFESAR
jgi:hypothetical protein